MNVKIKGINSIEELSKKANETNLGFSVDKTQGKRLIVTCNNKKFAVKRKENEDNEFIVGLVTPIWIYITGAVLSIVVSFVTGLGGLIGMFIIMLVVLGIMDTIYKASNKGELNKLIPLLTAIEIQETTGRVTNAEPQKTKDADKSASNVGAQSDKSTTSDPEMVEVQGDTFTMGCTSEQGDDCVSPEKPAHSVTVCPSLAQQRHPAEPEMVEVQGGTFTMGYTSEQGDDSFSNEKPAHSVTVNSFQIGKNI